MQIVRHTILTIVLTVIAIALLILFLLAFKESAVIKQMQNRQILLSRQIKELRIEQSYK